MQPYFVIFGRVIPFYGVFLYVGVFAAVILAVIFCKRKGNSRDEIVCSAVYIFIGLLVGAKLLYILVSLPKIIEGFSQGTLTVAALFQGGFVFYGGLFGGIFGLWVYCKQFHYSMAKLAECYAAVLPLGHAFGRIGCFFAGCCYGMPHDGWCSISYPEYYEKVSRVPVGVSLLPIQLIEALGLLLIFGVTMTVFLKTKDKLGYTIPIYVIAYGVLRFVLEFFRGDAARGVFLLSTSQWISIGMVAAVVAWLVIKHKKKLRGAL